MDIILTRPLKLGGAWHKAGETLSLGLDEAARLQRIGAAVIPYSNPPAEPPVKPPAETSAAKKK